MNKRTISYATFLVFVILLVYFSSQSIFSQYSGITVNYQDGHWIVKDIHKDGSVDRYLTLKGEEIIEINHRPVEENFLASHFLIIEKINSITIMRGGLAKSLNVYGKSNAINFAVLALLSSSLALLSYFCFTKMNVGKISNRYALFIYLTAVMVISIVPSSQGEILARAIIVGYVNLFPLFIDSFIRATILKSGVANLSVFSKVILWYAGVTEIIYIISLFFQFPMWVYIYLARGIFYICLIFLLILLLATSYRYYSQKYFYAFNTLFLIFLSTFPFFIGYVLPIGKEVPFIYTIPILLLGIISVVTNLIIERFLHVHWSIKPIFLYLLLTLVFAGILLTVCLLSSYVPIWIMIIYIFLVSLGLLPEVRKLVIISRVIDENVQQYSIFSAIESEREEISDYIHDSTIQSLVYHKKELEVNKDIDREAVMGVLDDAIFDLRELCSHVYPLMIRELGLENSILSVANKFMQSYNVEIEVFADIDQAKLSSQLESFILRTIRELINNSILHGRSQRIQVCLSAKSYRLDLKVQDDGDFLFKDSDDRPHFGLKLIKEKVQLLKGQVDISINPTIIQLHIPLEESYD